MASEVRVEEATMLDIEACLDINRNIYAGFDYLPGLYRHYMHDVNTKIFVAKLGGKIVSSSALCQCH